MTERRLLLDVKALEFAYGAPSRYRRADPALRDWMSHARASGVVGAADGAFNGLFHLGPISFNLCAGEFLSIIGPNGSGKSTLLGLLGGLLSPARGQVRFGGREVSLLEPRERARRVAYVRQESPLVFPISVEDFVLLGRFPFADRLGFHSARDRETACWAMEVTSLDRLAARRLDEISGGERQRVVLARALAQEPELLLLDEPTANLDLNFQVEMLRLICRLAEEHGFVVIAVMHELNLASEFSEHVLLLKGGRLFRYGEPSEVLTRAALEEVYDVLVSVDRNPYSGRPRVTLAAGR